LTLLNQTAIKLIVFLSDRLSTPKLTQRHHRRQFQEFQDFQSDRLHRSVATQQSAMPPLYALAHYTIELDSSLSPNLTKLQSD